MASDDDAAKAFTRLSLAESIPCSKPAAKPPASAFDRMMTIEVEGEEFQMHRGLLCFHSTYFKNLLDGPFREGGSNRHTLTEVSLDTFTMFYNWVYTGSAINNRDLADTYLDTTEIVNLYVFADFHMVDQLANRALELFFMQMARRWEVDTLCTAAMYEQTTSESGLRKLHVDILLATFGFADWMSGVETFPKEFVVDLFEACRKQGIAPGATQELSKVGYSSWIKNKRMLFCKMYHDHQELELRPTTLATPLSFASADGSCASCGEEGHILDICPHLRARGKITCYNCEEQGHISHNCRKPKDWSKVKCRNCNATGHGYVECPEPISN